MKGNSKHVKCNECKSELDTLPSNREQSSLVCGNWRCGRYGRVQHIVKVNNEALFKLKLNQSGVYYKVSSYRSPINSRLAKYSE